MSQLQLGHWKARGIIMVTIAVGLEERDEILRVLKRWHKQKNVGVRVDD
jgi:hypothetical protein